MNKYYLFIIKDEFYKRYRNKEHILYKALKYLYKMNSYDLQKGIYIYHKICAKISVNLLKNYIDRKYKYYKVSNKIIKMDSIIEETYIEFKHSCIIVVTNMDFPFIFSILNIYNRQIFFCNFDKEKFGFLKDYVRKYSEFIISNTYTKVGDSNE